MTTNSADWGGYDTDGSGGEAGPGLRHYLDVVRRRRVLVLAIFGVAVCSALGFSLSEQPVYSAHTTIVVGQGNSLFQPGEANAVQPFTATMADLVKSNIVAKRVIADLHLDRTPQSLLGQVSVSINPQTANIKIGVEDHSRRRAVAIAERTGEVFSQLVRQRFGTRALPPAAAGLPAQQPLTASVFDPAHADPGRVSPKPTRDALLAGVLGFLLGLMAAFLRDHFDRDLRTREAVEAAFAVPVIGQVPHMQIAAKGARVLETRSFGPVHESLRTLRANLDYLGVQRPLRTLLVTSAGPTQGKTTLVGNLAVVLAQSGLATLAIDCDLRRPTLHELFSTRTSQGLTSVLVGAAEDEDALVELPYGRNGDSGVPTGRLSLLPSGPLPPNPSELLSSPQMAKLLDRVGGAYDYVLLDSPPLLLVADALNLARSVDGVVLAVRRGHATTDEAQETRALLARLGVNLIGTVFTDTKTGGSYGYEPYGRAPAAPTLDPGLPI